MNAPTEEVQRLLASLASYSNQSSSSNLAQAPAHQSTYAQPLLTSGLPGLIGVPPDRPVTSSTPTPIPYEPALTPRPSTSTPDPRLKRPLSRTREPVPLTSSTLATTAADASNITDWPTAIAHVMAHLLPDPTFASKIRRLITSQHAHERDWHEKRAAIEARHAGRSTSSAQLSSIFASLGVPQRPGTTATPGTSSAEGERLQSERDELAAYDAKVYKQLLALAGDFDRQLRGLGVPFYAIRHELVVLEEGRERQVGNGEVVGKRVDKGELRELQRRMLGWLEMSFPVDE